MSAHGQPEQPAPDLSERYVYVKDLGKGAFGRVVLADVKGGAAGEQVAIKQLARDRITKYVATEILNHSKLRHPHVISFREVFLTDDNINIVMDYAPGGALLEYLRGRKRLREAGARWFFQQLLFAVDYCHRKGVVNRDIKLDNLLLQPLPGLPRPLVKLADFGFSKFSALSHVVSRVGTVDYMAPEVLLDQGAGYDARASDVWSCGVVLYTLLVGHYPFEGAPGDGAGQKMAQYVAARVKRMRARQLEFPEWLQLSGQCTALLQRLLEPDPARRATVADVMQDPWFQVELPPNALGMNDKYVALPRGCAQSEDDIRSLVSRARSDGLLPD